jgi:competence protein ComEA
LSAVDQNSHTDDEARRVRTQVSSATAAVICDVSHREIHQVVNEVGQLVAGLGMMPAMRQHFVMRVFMLSGVCVTLVGGVGGWCAPPLVAQSALPEAPGREITVKLCGTCHPADTVASQRLAPEGWREMIKRMVAAGAEGNEQQLETVFQYLSTHFPVEAQKPLDLNTATAVELESVAGLLRKEAAALIAHRVKNGPCKKLDDLKEVAGLDYKKIDARKERLACM